MLLLSACCHTDCKQSLLTDGLLYCWLEILESAGSKHTSCNLKDIQVGGSWLISFCGCCLHAGRSVKEVLMHIKPAELASREAGWCPLPASSVEVFSSPPPFPSFLRRHCIISYSSTVGDNARSCLTSACYAATCMAFLWLMGIWLQSSGSPSADMTASLVLDSKCSILSLELVHQHVRGKRCLGSPISIKTSILQF